MKSEVFTNKLSLIEKNVIEFTKLKLVFNQQ